MSFLDVIFAHCQEHKMNQTQFEREVGLPKGSVSKWKNKGFKPNYNTQLKLSAYLGMTAEELMNGQVGSKPEVSSDKVWADTVNEASIHYIPVLRDVINSVADDPENVIKYLPSFPDTIEHPEECYAMRMPDSSMEPWFRTGDIIIVQRCSEPDSGDTVVVCSPGAEPLVRKLIRAENRIILQPANSEYDAQSYTYEEMDMLTVYFSGKVTGMLRNVWNHSEVVDE